MCYIKRRIFPCCSRENWYSYPIPQQCNGIPRCTSGDCIILGARATVLDHGKCWRCILEDMKKGVRPSVNDRALREAQKIGGENGWAAGVGQAKKKKEKKEKKVKKEKGEGRKRKRAKMEEEEEINEEPRAAKKMREWNGVGGFVGAGMSAVRMPFSPPSEMSQQGLYQRTNLWMARPQTSMQVKPVQAPSPPYDDVDMFRNISQPALKSKVLSQNPSTNLEQLNFGNGANPFLDSTINPSLLNNWGDPSELDRLLAQDSNMDYLGGNGFDFSTGQDASMDELAAEWSAGQGNMFAGQGNIDQNAILDQQAAESLAGPKKSEQSTVFDQQTSTWQNPGNSLDQWAGFEDTGAGWLAQPADLNQKTVPEPKMNLTSNSNQGKAVEQKASSGPPPSDDPMWDDFDFNLWLETELAQGSSQQETPSTSTSQDNRINLNQEAAVARNADVILTRNPASIPLGDPMQFQSDLENFDDIFQWPIHESHEESRQEEEGGLDEESRKTLHAILFDKA